MVFVVKKKAKKGEIASDEIVAVCAEETRQGKADIKSSIKITIIIIIIINKKNYNGNNNNASETIANKDDNVVGNIILH